MLLRAGRFMQLYGPKEGLRLYMAQQAAIKAAKEAQAAEEAAKRAAAIQAMPWYERCSDLTPAVSSLRGQLTTLQEIIVPCRYNKNMKLRTMMWQWLLQDNECIWRLVLPRL